MKFSKTLITYCEDTNALIAEVVSKYPERMDITDPTDAFFNIIKTPTVRNGMLTLTAVLSQSPLEEEMLKSLSTLEVLGTYDDIFSSSSLDTKYQLVYPYSTPITFVDEEGNTQSYYRPQKIGEFA